MTNNTDTPNTDTPQVPVSPLPARGLLEQFLVFINTPIGVWLLTSGFIGLIVWQYQQHQQYMQERAVRMQTIAHLNAEITGRISQFGTWARNNLIQSSNTYSFKQGITETTVIDAIKGLDSVPGKDNKVGIAFGLFPENSQQTLFALYIELNIRTSEQKEFGDVTEEDANTRIVEYQYAEQALIDPTALFGYRTLNHNVFICNFQRTFLTKNVINLRVTSADCLENDKNGKCITYAEVKQCIDLEDH